MNGPPAYPGHAILTIAMRKQHCVPLLQKDKRPGSQGASDLVPIAGPNGSSDTKPMKTGKACSKQMTALMESGHLQGYKPCTSWQQAHIPSRTRGGRLQPFLFVPDGEYSAHQEINQPQKPPLQNIIFLIMKKYTPRILTYLGMPLMCLAFLFLPSFIHWNVESPYPTEVISGFLGMGFLCLHVIISTACEAHANCRNWNIHIQSKGLETWAGFVSCRMLAGYIPGR